MSSQPINVLISLHKGYGLGDCVQMSAVLRHVAKYRKHWIVDYQAEEGRHQVGRGIVSNTFAYGQPYPSAHYDAEVLICLYDTWANWQDRPNTRVSSCLHEHFDLPWDAECGRYRVNVSEVALLAAARLIEMVGDGRKVVGIHHKGISSKDKKDLTDAQTAEVCNYVSSLGCVPLLLDWCDCYMFLGTSIKSVKRFAPPEWGSDAEMNCAIISQCKAFVGIDSGPGKCASATNTPTIITWTGHHPAPFHDPAPNTTHLVPSGYHGLYPVCNDPGVIAWFENHHTVRQYSGCPTGGIKQWLKEVLT